MRGARLLALVLLAACAGFGGRALAADTPTVQRTTFDHLTTGFELLGQHRDLPCESCHVNAIFKGTSRECQSCHGVGTSVRASAKPANHLLTTNACAFCHTPVGWSPAVNFSHSEVLGSCASCHYKGSPVGGMGPNHIVTDLDCNVCHSTVGWAGAVFNHNGRTTGCASCHNNVSATGQPATHVPTIPAGDGTCEGCHTPTNYTTWHDVTGTAAVHATAAGWACASCHETAQFMGMTPSTATVAHDSRPSAALDPSHPPTGDCGVCHDTTSFTAAASLKPANHIPTNAPCTQCHTTPGQYASYSVTGVHQGATACLSCHAPAVAGTFANITIVSTPANHIPIGNLDCNGSGCHSTGNVSAGGFRLGAASVTAPTLNVAGHATVAGQVAACSTCHETAPYVGMIASTNTTAGDSRPNATLDKVHPASGDCSGCHTTTPTFSGNVSSTAKPSNHIPTTAPCAQCHTTAGNYATYSVTGTHQGVTTCLGCHAAAVANTFANISIVTVPGNHMPIGNLDCNGSGCHSTAKVTAGGFRIGTASITTPTLNFAGHTTVLGVVPACTTCHETAPYVGMIASTASSAGDSRPTLFDKLHPTTGDCTSCHSTAPTFAGNVSNTAKPANHIPTTAPCTQCHLVQNNYATYDRVGTHKGVADCLSCHASGVAGTFANITITTTPGNHIPVGNLDCNGSGCHTTGNVNAGGFKLGTANINTPTLSLAGHTTVAGQVGACSTCHEAASFLGMVASTSTVAGDSRPNATLDKLHPASGDCGDCHTMTPVFATNVSKGTKPANHIPTTATCSQCHTTAGNFALYSVTGVHQGVSNCLSCHAPSVANTFANVTIVTTPGNHMPIGNLDCNGSGCHTTAKVTAGGFRIGSASITVPTLNVTGHTTVAAQVAACTTCHETAPFVGMIASTATTAGDSRPTAFDKAHPTSGDCSGCHTTTPVFGTNQTAGAKPANHIPTTAPCTQCHTTAGNYAAYSVTGTHQGVTTCLNCHAAAVANTFANVTIVSTPGNHMPIGNLDCNGSGCHTTAKVTAGGFRIGSASITAPTLTVTGHTTVAGQVPACTSCHESAAFVGMLASTSTTAGDSRPNATLDKAHPTTGDCSGCHSTSPTFANNQSGNAKPANHIPTLSGALCTQCHTTAGNYAAYSVTGTHQGVTTCLNCHGSTVANSFANVTIVTTPSNHIPISTLDCNGSGCHTTAKLTAGGFRIGSASITAPTLTVAGHTTVATKVTTCTSCHETAAFAGMIASTSSAAGDSRPNLTLDKNHPTAGDCSGCHTTTPTFNNNVTGGAKPANHIPTSAPCAQCHTTGNNALYDLLGVHKGISTGCATCHAYGLSFANMAPPTLVQPPSGSTGHIPSNPPNGSTLNVACELCHIPPGNIKVGGFAGTIMKHQYVTAMKCMSCHELGMKWKTNTGVRLWVRDSASHHPGQDCGGSGCHSSRDKLALRPAARVQGGAQTRATAAAGVAATVAPTGGGAFSHSRIAGSDCFSCHNGANGTGKPAEHIATTNSCTSCHNTFAWLPVVRVDHSQVRGACATCHDGRIARARSASHIASSTSCETCHTTNAWTPARFDHGAVAAHTCTRCHDGVHAPGKPVNHVPTQAQCDTCHGTLGWKPAKMDHTTLTANCVACHNNALALGVPGGHMVTKLDCASCHSYPEWTLVRFTHHAAGYPGDHKVAPACNACHVGNTEQVPWSSPASAGSCAGCHAKDFKPALHRKTVGGVLYSASELHDCSGACHVYSDATLKSVAKPQPGPYHRVSDGAFKH